MNHNRGMASSSSRSRVTSRSQNWRSRAKKNVTSRPAVVPSSYVTTASLHGGKRKIPVNPPDVTYQPWTHLTVVDSFVPSSGTKSWKVKDVVRLMVAQIDPTGHAFRSDTIEKITYPVLQFKMLEVHVWNLTGRMVALSATDFIDTSPGVSDLEQLCGLVDTGAVGTTPKLGYQYPAAHRSHVLRNDHVSSEVYLFNIQAGSADNCIVYIKIQYKFDGPVKIPQLTTPEYIQHQQLLHQSRIEANTSGSKRELQKTAGVLGSIKSVLGSVVERLPSTAQKIIDGVEVAALIVTALADNEGFDMIGDVDVDAIVEAVASTNIE